MNNISKTFEEIITNYKELIAISFINNKQCIDKTYFEFLRDIYSTWRIISKYDEKRIAVLGSTSYQWLCVAYACMLGGKDLVLLDSTLYIGDMEILTKQVDTQRIILVQKNEEYSKVIPEIERFNKNVSVISLEDIISNEIEINEKSVSDMLMEMNKSDMESEVICFTSGTSNLAKGVVLNTKKISMAMKNESSKVYAPVATKIYVPVPTYHILGFMTIISVLYNGQRACMGEGIKKIKADINMFKPSVVIIVPSVLEFLFKTNTMPQEVKTVILGGSNCYKELELEAQKRDIELLTGYGLSEACGGVAKNIVDKGIHRYRANKGVEFGITSEGEVTIKYDVLLDCYYNNEKATREALKDGVFYTGDLGYIDEENMLHISGRIKDILVMDNGEKVNAVEVDQVINAIEGVLEGAITYINKELVAFIVPSEGYLPEYFEEKIAEYNLKQPYFRKISRVIVRDNPLPRTSSGKLKRRELYSV